MIIIKKKYLYILSKWLEVQELILEAKIEADSRTEVETKTEADSRTEVEREVDSRTEAETDSRTEVETDSRTEVETDSRIEMETEAEPRRRDLSTIDKEADLSELVLDPESKFFFISLI